MKQCEDCAAVLHVGDYRCPVCGQRQTRQVPEDDGLGGLCYMPLPMPNPNHLFTDTEDDDSRRRKRREWMEAILESLEEGRRRKRREGMEEILLALEHG